MRKGALFLTAIAALHFVCGCESDQDHIGGAPGSKAYRTAASLSPSATELLVTYCYEAQFVGGTGQDNWPVISRKPPVILNGVKPNYEKIAEIHPGVVIYDDLMFSQPDIDKIKELGIDVVPVTGNTVEEFVQCIYRLGAAFHTESNIAEYADNVEAAVAAAKATPPVKHLKVAVMMPGHGSEHMICGTNSFVADVVRKCGAEPVGPNADRFVTASPESLIALNPDVIVSSGEGSSIQNDPRLQSIAAVRNKRVGGVEPDLLLRRGARVDRLIRGLNTYLVGAART